MRIKNYWRLKMSRRIFTAPAIISGIGTQKDGTIKMSVYVAKELPAKEMTTLFGFNDSHGVMMFAEKQADLEDVAIPDYKTEFKTDKTPSVRLRAVLFLRWEQQGKVGDFDSHYKQQMERFIEAVKEKLN